MPLSKQPQATTGRWILMFLVLGSAFLSHTILFYEGRSGRIHPEGVQSIIRTFLDVYFPLLAVMTAFYFAETPAERRAKKAVDLQVLFFATVVTGLWAFTPVALIIFVPTIERVQLLLGVLEPFGQTAALAAVVFFFGKAS